MPQATAEGEHPRLQATTPLAEPSRKLALIGAVAAAPLVAGALLPASSSGEGPALCLMRHAVGVPCPFCGATRAFIEFGHGSGEWISSYNGFWVLVSIAALALACFALLASWRSSRVARVVAERLERLSQAPLAIPALMLLLIVPGWIWALTNRTTIV